jgi:hypothetical protein
MKKLLTILAAALIVSAPVFASVSGKSADVQLKTNIAETPVSYELAYNGDVIEDQTTNYEIGVLTLTKDGSTKDFTVIATSNLNDDLSVFVDVVPSTFQTTLNNGNDNYDSGIKPSVNTTEKVSTLTAGKHVDLLVNKFNLSWSGDEDLPAGDYVSNVKIMYSIN